MEANKVFRYGTSEHDQLRDRLRARLKVSQDTVNAERLDQWARNEEQFRAYMPVRENDQLRKNARQYKGEPQFTTIEIPYSYAILLTAHTYITSTFLSRNPVLQIAGRHGESQNAEMAMEALLDYQVNTGEHLVPYYVWTLDALKYGCGIVGYYWDEEIVRVRKREQQPQTFLGIPIPGAPPKVVETVEDVRGYCGTRLFNVRPQDFFPDPAYSLSQFQKGEFCGRFVQIQWLDILDGEKDGTYFNVDALRRNRKEATRLRVDGSPQVTLPNNPNYIQLSDDYTTGTVDAHEIIVRLVPQDWKLGKESRTEKWVFTLAENEIVIGARPLGYYHNRFPFGVLESEVDGHALFSRSMLENLKPLNDVLTWLLNTHFYNVRKSLNDQLLVDPSKVVMKDLTNPNPGRLVRLKPSAYGSDVRLAVQQLAVQDITRANIADAQLIEEMIQRVSGVNDNIMGMLGSGRKTATEVRSSTTFGVNRLKTITEYMSAMGFGPLTQQLVQVTQQLYDDDRKFRVVGNAAQYAGRFLQVTPEQIAGFYDFVPVDGTMPVDRMTQVNLWNQLFAQAAQLPAVMQQYDFTKIFAFVAQLAGLKNIDMFRIQIVPDAAAANAVQAGNSLPIEPQDMEGVAQNGGNVQPPQIPGQGQAL